MSTSNSGLTAATTPLTGTEVMYVVQGGNSRKATTGNLYIPGGTDVAVTDGGTGASTALAARTNLGLAIGTDVQAYSANLASWGGVTRASGYDTFAATPTSANLRALLSDEVGTGAAYFVGGALGTPASGVATNLTGLPLSTGVTGAFAQTTTGFFWADAGARIHKMNDRIMLGAATINDGNAVPTVKDWLETIRNSTTKNSQFAVLSSIGQTAILAGTRTSDFPLAGGQGSIAYQGWAINDDTVGVQASWAGYFEARRSAGAGSTFGIESEPVNSGSVVDVSAYGTYGAASGITAALWAGSGGEVGTADVSVVLGVVPNPTRFRKGIVFNATSLTGTDGTGTGTATAFELARDHKISWVKQNASAAADIYSDVTNGGPYQLAVFTDLGLLYRNTLAKNLLRIDAADTFVNGFVLFPKAAGSTPLFQAVGDDTNVGLGVATQGTGTVDFYTNTSVRQLQVAHVASAVNYVRNSGAITTAAPLISVDGSDTNIGLGHATKGTGVFDFFTNTNVRQLQVAHIASAVNYLKTAGAATTASPTISVDGSDTNVSFAHATKGTGVFDFFTNTSVRQVQIAHVATAVNYLQLKGAATTGAPTISAVGSDTNIPLTLTTKGTESLYLQSGGNIAAQFQTAASTVNWILTQGALTTAQPQITATGNDTNVTGVLQGKGTGGWQIKDGGAVVKAAFNSTGIGFFAATPVAKQTVGAALSTGGAETNTNLATRINDLRTALINYGLAA